MKYKYNIRHKVGDAVEIINFKNKQSMLSYLDKNKSKLDKMNHPVLNFSEISLPLNQTVWSSKA